jgi:hypothetical protein
MGGACSTNGGEEECISIPGSHPGLESGICGGQSGVGTGFLLVLRFLLPKPFIPPTSPSSQSLGQVQ